MFKYKIIYSKRKSIAIQITSLGEVLVRAPKKVPIELIEDFVSSKLNWIDENLMLVLKKQQYKDSFSLSSGSHINLLGREYPVVLGDKCLFNGEQLIISSSDFNTIKPDLIKIFKVLARNVINERVSFFSNEMKLFPTAIRINSAKTRWGSCSGKNSLNFSWRLVFGSYDVIDYVVVHELSHIKEHNHSKRFWEVVSYTLPDYKKREKALKELQVTLSTQNWD